jgi:hypothetical protein
MASHQKSLRWINRTDDVSIYQNRTISPTASWVNYSWSSSAKRFLVLSPLRVWKSCNSSCVSVSPLNAFVFYAVRVVPKESSRLVLPRTYCIIIISYIRPFSKDANYLKPVICTTFSWFNNTKCNWEKQKSIVHFTQNRWRSQRYWPPIILFSTPLSASHIKWTRNREVLSIHVHA